MKKRTKFQLAALVAAVASAASHAHAQATLTTLASFNPMIGAEPIAGVIADSSGNLFGTAFVGGPDPVNGDGTVYELMAGSTAPTVVASFNGNPAMSSSSYFASGPHGGLLADSSGNLYGTTKGLGTENDGTVYEVAAGTHTPMTLANFNGTNGAAPVASLIADGAGNLYGTTQQGGADGDGTVFEVAAGTHALTTLASLNFNSGAGPWGRLLLDAAGNLYGTTITFGPGGNGTVFEVAANTHTLSILTSFPAVSTGSNVDYGYSPVAGLIADSAGDLYGTTLSGGMNDQALGGTIFEITATTHTLKYLAVFDGTDGNSPESDLIADAAGNLYGTTLYGGPDSYGSVFELVAATDTIKDLFDFNGTNGQYPIAGLTADAQGNLYGTTEFGGNGYGTIFELSNAGFVVPEPTSLSLIAILGCATLMRRRRTPKHIL